MTEEQEIKKVLGIKDYLYFEFFKNRSDRFFDTTELILYRIETNTGDVEYNLPI